MAQGQAPSAVRASAPAQPAATPNGVICGPRLKITEGLPPRRTVGGSGAPCPCFQPRSAAKRPISGQPLMATITGGDCGSNGVSSIRASLIRKPHIRRQPGDRVVAGGRGELAAGRQLLTPPGEQLLHLRLHWRHAQLRAGRDARPVHLIKRALNDAAGACQHWG